MPETKMAENFISLLSVVVAKRDIIDQTHWRGKGGEECDGVDGRWWGRGMRGQGGGGGGVGVGGVRRVCEGWL